jgi:curli biogenesis system outer membrane secretion channel CsgG
MKRLSPVFVLAFLTAPVLAQAPAARKRVAVLDFDYATVHSFVMDIWGSDQDIGKGIADMLVTQLVRNGTYSVIERNKLDQVLREQNFQQSGRADASTAAQLGRILGVDAIIIGSITQFGRDDKKVGLGGGVRVGGIGIGGIGRRQAKAVVQIDARIVDIKTAEILGVATGHGESKRSGTTLIGGASVGGVAAGGAFDMSSSNFGNTILGEATRGAVDSLVTELVGASGHIQETVAIVAALVADVAGSELIINAGTSGGVRVGAEYQVVRPGREIKDPATGRVLRRTTTPVGKIKITSADEASATGTLSGGPAKVGDCVGTCPTNTGGGAPPEDAAARPLNQSAPTSPPAFSAGGALPAVYTAPISGPFSWSAYGFKGTEHFKYDVSSNDGGEAKTGSYSFDAQPAGPGRFRLTVDGRLGTDSYRSSLTVGAQEGVPMMQLAALGPVGVTLFSPMWGFLFMGHQWEMGSFWSTTQNGETSSFKVESACSYSGVSGLRGVLRQNDQPILDMCVSPKVALPLAVTMSEAGGGSTTAMRLVEFRP